MVYNVAMSSVNAITLKLRQEEVDKVLSLYDEEQTAPSSPYVFFEAKTNNCRVFVYTKKDKEGCRKVLFQGALAREEASVFGYVPEAKEIAKPSPFPQIGSDEVGTGDFFGPVIVVSTLVKKSDLPFLKKLGVTDSKKIEDEKILEIAPKLIARLPYSSLTVDNRKYNELRIQGMNLNAMKAILHNAALLKLKTQYPKAMACIDQFAEPKTYFSYLKNEKHVLKDIAFSVRGELAFPSVAAASIIARFSFLKRMEELGKRYGCTFPFGAGKQVDEFAKEFLSKHGEEALQEVCKINFVNFKRIHED